MIVAKRVYDPYEPSDGYRVLIDRLWPRGVSRANAHIDAWEKDIAPSRELRQWYSHDPEKWPEFQKRYREELKAPDARVVLDDIVERAVQQRVTLVYSSRAGDISDAAVLEPMLARRVKARLKARASARMKATDARHEPGASAP